MTPHGGVQAARSADRRSYGTSLSATPLNPSSTATTVHVELKWSAVTGASGSNLYRRTSAGTYAATPVNGATPLAATSYVDPGTGLSGGMTYAYVVRAVSAVAAPASPPCRRRVPPLGAHSRRPAPSR